MGHAQKPDFVFRRNGRVHLNRRVASVQSTAGSRDVRISGSNTGYTMFRGSVKSTGYPLHSPVSPSLPLPVRHRVPSNFNWSLQPERWFRVHLPMPNLNKIWQRVYCYVPFPLCVYFADILLRTHNKSMPTCVSH
jgi:hypothetical protein